MQRQACAVTVVPLQALSAAAAMAVEMVPGTMCYIPDETHAWLQAQVISHDPSKKQVQVKVLKDPPHVLAESMRMVDFTDKKTVLLMSGKGQPNASIESLPVQNEATNVDDMITLNYLHEAAILYNIKARFLTQHPYTYTGDICIAVNPYQWLGELYSDDQHLAYQRLGRDELPPHVYATSVAAYRSMLHDHRNQSVLVSGESGAGKTETTKILMNHLASIAGGLRDATIAKIIMVNPLLESFGNAKTLRNDNSSRFGKFTQLQFDAHGTLVGAQCKTYLLEKTRVVTHEPSERNYHIFYQVLAVRSRFPELHLDELATDYNYVGPLHTSAIEGHSDAAHFDKTQAALDRIGMDAATQRALFRVLAGILHLGQIQFAATSDEASQVASQCPHTNHVCTLLGVERTALERALCCRTMQARHDKYSVPLTKVEAEQCRDALAKGLYANVFEWLVALVNASLSHASRQKHHIGVLDIFGFEHFEHNSFEQFCINYANEKLQQKFTFDVFKTVQVEYEDEGIQWNHVAYADNADVLQVIESKLGLLSLLDEELVRPKGNEESFVAKAALLMKDDAVIEFPRTSRTQFVLRHYAAPVLYEVTGFLEKHKDAMLPDLATLMRSSSASFVSALFADPAVPSPATSKRRQNSAQNRVQTVGVQFKTNLSELMGTIQATNVQYIRCIKPNAAKSPTSFDHAMVIAQLRCAGVIEAIRIARSAYPVRQTHVDFLATYGMCFPDILGRTQSSKDLCLQILAQVPSWTAPVHFQVGRSKIYFHARVVEDLEHRKRQYLYAKVVLMQRILRGCTKRRQYRRKLDAIVKIQSVVRCVLAYTRYNTLVRGTVALQSQWRGIKARQLYFVLQRQHKAHLVFAFVLGAHQRRRFLQLKASAVTIQSVVRMRLHRARFVQRMADVKSQQSMHQQLRTLQERLQVEQNKKQHHHRHRRHDPSSADQLDEHDDGQQRRKSSAQLVMADAGGMIDRIEKENVRLRREVEELKAALATWKDDADKLKQDKEIATAAHHVKLRQAEELARDKDKTIAQLHKELDRVRGHPHGGGTPPSLLQYSSSRSRRTVMGSRRDRRGLERSEDSPEEVAAIHNGAVDVAAAVQKAIETNAFLIMSAQQLGASLDVDATATRMALSNGLVTANSLRASPSVSSLKDRVAQMKNKYAQRQSEQVHRASEDSLRQSVSDSLYRGSMAVPPMPPGWEMRMSRSKGRPYFCHEGQRLTLWDPPTEENIEKAIAKRDSSVRKSVLHTPVSARSSSRGL
ncbi:hypothetical protein, variant 1 [Aphanomyces astaci]|uniref:Myosin motor domain-containing protein n=1 Tax=Aphanomyces astaci TaxID=112090 RepID=W4HCF6_APHAT|nr:hypothetical protein, variant 1 [Aphanomyces astaci]ETV88974.1 hypothetical protein, variant 1 [Aphanomyces astaci]|eukprot:XP_009821374.1 hypothetical protein, variant 1 [Aphanomyces astaci]